MQYEETYNYERILDCKYSFNLITYDWELMLLYYSMLITIVGLDTTGREVYEALTQRCRTSGVTINAYDLDSSSIESLLEADIIMICDTRTITAFCSSLTAHAFRGLVVIKGYVKPGTFDQLVETHGQTLYLVLNPHTEQPILIATPSRFKQSHLNNLINFYRIFYRGMVISLCDVAEAERSQHIC